MRRYGGATRDDLADSGNWLSRRSADRYVHATAEGVWIAPLNSRCRAKHGRQQISTPKSLMLHAAKYTPQEPAAPFCPRAYRHTCKLKSLFASKSCLNGGFAGSLAKCGWARNILRHVSCSRHAPHKRCVNGWGLSE